MWNTVGKNPATARNIGPNSQSLDEGVHIIKFDLEADLKGATFEERFRGEFYKLNSAYTNASSGNLSQRVGEGTSYFQGANTMTVSKNTTSGFSVQPATFSAS